MYPLQGYLQTNTIRREPLSPKEQIKLTQIFLELDKADRSGINTLQAREILDAAIVGEFDATLAYASLLDVAVQMGPGNVRLEGQQLATTTFHVFGMEQPQ